ncbi:heavy metal translocating P-type ATPase [Acholeplasma granularum]|uniref:heavy metal translocating P-type ATPase n=1 Tax=Acholeplasma granularum TaxID=264635 RepID=UPI0004BB6F62|nr:heavy metal translocating P-type ATPase [Acholeplasma granularum]
MKKLFNKLNIEFTVVTISVILIITSLILHQTILPDVDGKTPTILVIMYGISFLLGGFFKAKEGVEETIANKALNVEILMIIAALAAFIIGNPAEAALLIMIFAVSGLLETFAHNKSQKELTSLLNISPDLATLYNDGIETQVSVKDLKKGDVVIVKVGDAVPVDGVITRGQTAINQAAITGESMPVNKDLGDQVFAGTYNLNSPILIKITVSPEEFVVNKIIDLVTAAQENQGKQQTRIEKIEKWYVYFVLLLALGFMIIPPLLNIWNFNDAFYRGTVVLVVGSPCALVASVAPTMLSTLSNAARHRILIKGGQHLEALSKINVVVFDKTGTITEGKPVVESVYIDASLNKKEILDIVYSMEKLSNHPLANAITTHLQNESTYQAIKVDEIPGMGMSYTVDSTYTYQVGKFSYKDTYLVESKMLEHQNLGHSIVQIILNNDLIGFISLMDKLRPDVRKMIDNLIDQNIMPVLLTGDNEQTAKAIAKAVGIEHVIAGALPNEKSEHVKKLQTKYGKVMMVGDGINDAPALAIADIGAAMGTGTDVSLETADVIFMNNNLNNIDRLFRISKANQVIVYQNMTFSIAIILTLLSFNIFGLVNLPFGVVAHEGSTILVILNGLRMLLKK